jgi:transcriptional regulator with XRE-family HTH domain
VQTYNSGTHSQAGRRLDNPRRGNRTRKRRQAEGSPVLGLRIRKMRIKRGLSQEATAHRVGRSPGWLLMVEKGQADPGYSDLVNLAAVFEVDVGQLIAEHHDGHAPAMPASHGELLDVERLGRVMQRPASIDDGYLDQLEVVIRWYWQGYQTTNPSLLLPALSGQLVQLWPLTDMSLAATTSRRLRSLVGHAASLGGWLALRLSNRAGASVYWALAEALATDAEDRALRAFVLASRSSLYTSTLHGGSQGDTGLALALLDAAAGTGADTSPVQHAWTLARRAEEHAVRGDEQASKRDMTEAGRHLSQTRGCGEGYFAAWDEAQLSGYRGSCAQALGSSDAVPLLERSLALTDGSLISQRTAILANLGAAHAQQGHVDEACAALTEALTVAGRSSLAVSIERVRGIRRRLDAWSNTVEVRRLDEMIGSLG